MPIAETRVGAMLRQTITEKELSKSRVAEQLECSRMTLDHWLRGFSTPSLDRLPKLVAFTGLPGAEVLEALLADNGVDADVDHADVAIPGYLNRGIPEAA